MAQKRAFAYYRTSSASGVGEDTDTKTRQQEAVKKYALIHNTEIVAEFYDANVRGAIPVEERREFKKMLAEAKRKDIDMILVETANRFARDVMVQLTGHDLLKGLGIRLVPVDAPEHFNDEDNPTAEMLRIIIAAVAMYQKKDLVNKLGSGRMKKRELTGRCEGRIPPPAGAIEMAKDLRATGMSFARIGEELSRAGYRVIQKNPETNEHEVTDRIYKPQSVKNMIENF